MRQGKFSRLLEKLAIDQPQARAWAMYDWANSAMVTTIITAVFPVYFMVVARGDMDEDLAQERYLSATVWALAATAILSPVLGALADMRAAKKKFLAAFVAIGVVAVGAMWFIGEGDWKLALGLFALANVGAASSVVFYDSLLPHVTKPERMDQLSASGFALGYIGGGLLLALNLAWIKFPEWFFMTSGDETLPSRVAFLSVALWWAGFSVPLFLRVPEPKVSRVDSTRGPLAVLRATGRVFGTIRHLANYRQAFLMLVAFLIYNDGITTVIRVATVYATGRGIDPSITILTVLIVQFVGVPFSFLFGMLATRWGAKKPIYLGLAIYGVICGLGYFMSSNWHFVALGFLVAMVQGGTQALSRSLFASLIPKDKSAEFFAFFSVGEKFAGIAGPAIMLWMMKVTGAAENAMLSLVVFFAIGFVLLRLVDVDKGRAEALVQAQST